jgi:curved DNA-binding protein CbpA
MKTLYDLLGARPDDDAGELQNAFRRAAKASRADLHAGNPDALKRFRQIVKTYDILRDAERRAAYDRLLALKRKQHCSKLTRAVSCLVHNIVSDAIGVVSLVVVLAGGHTLFAYLSKPPANAVEVTVRGPAEAAGIPPPPRVGAVEPDNKPATTFNMPKTPPSADAVLANNAGTPEAIKGAPGPNPMGPSPAPSPAPISGPSPEPSSGSSPSDRREIGTNELKMPRTKITEKRQAEPKRQAKDRAPVKQASLENRKTPACSHGCSRDEPPLFGVGF